MTLAGSPSMVTRPMSFPSAVALAFATRLIIMHFLCMAAWLAMKITKNRQERPQDLQGCLAQNAQ